MNVKERIKFFIKFKKMSVLEFERSILAGNGYINSISKSIGIDKLNLILEKYPNINLEWLLTGKGEMLKKIEVSEQKNEIGNEIFFRLLSEKDKKIEELNKKIWDMEMEIQNLREVPVRGKTIDMVGNNKSKVL
jgi:hypothetical protein